MAINLKIKLLQRKDALKLMLGSFLEDIYNRLFRSLKINTHSVPVVFIFGYGSKSQEFRNARENIFII